MVQFLVQKGYLTPEQVETMKALAAGYLKSLEDK